MSQLFINLPITFLAIALLTIFLKDSLKDNAAQKPKRTDPPRIWPREELSHYLIND
ncbi:hypothetical protein EG328_011426 [Venturia inaequalis]|uniref:Uncharacterized protein n=1 Tax=Venturia inaequalis TaxID=5025 RepID=A0A8H3Z3D4_VENIN|nr:hypothetical protein EG328_011426 [Venturia inaequalis]